jgi:hypothetical protein
MFQTEPFLLRPGATAQRGTRLPRVHDRFDERFIQELLVEHPQLLPVAAFRSDIGELVCIGREVPTRDSGAIDNLYLSTTGYVVVVETKLWRNPQSRREVVSQVLDYVKDIVTRDFEWLSSVWTTFCGERGLGAEPLFETIRRAASDGELDEQQFVDRVQLALERGHVIALIVGDGIETRLQQLVSHLCQDSAHLRYSLGLVSLRCYEMPAKDEILVLPELVQEVEPVQRAYVRIELADSLAGQLRVTSVVQEPTKRPQGKRSTLNEDDLYDALVRSVGSEATDSVRQLVDNVSEMGIVPDFKSAAVMLKVPDPTGEALGASLLAIEKSGRVYNPDHGRNQVRRWGWDDAAFDRTIGAYWRRLHALDSRFLKTGISHLRPRDFLPLQEVYGKLDAIGNAMKEAVGDIQREA